MSELDLVPRTSATSKGQRHLTDVIRFRPPGVWARFRRRLRSFGHTFEQRFKDVLFGVLGSFMRLGSSRELPNWSKGPKRVLFLRYDKIGDMVLATGTIKAIVQAQPAVTVDVLASTYNAAVLEGNPYVGKVHTLNKKRPLTMLAALLRIRRARYDAVLDGMVLSPSLTNMLLMWMSRARHRIGVAGRGNDYVLTLAVAPVRDAVHYVDQAAALLGAFGVDLDRISTGVRAATPAATTPLRGMDPLAASNGWGVWRPEIYLSLSELEDGEVRWCSMASSTSADRSSVRLIVNVSAGAPTCIWREECFIATLQHVKERFPRLLPLVIGATEHRQRMERIARGADVQVAHTSHFRQMMALVAASDLVLTADTSVVHVASAFDKPVVAMFPASGGSAFGPYGTSGRAISTPGPSLESLEVEPVVQALDRAIIDSGELSD
jgi:ADP-heptose:LPS heptosyltransferase